MSKLRTAARHTLLSYERETLFVTISEVVKGLKYRFAKKTFEDYFIHLSPKSAFEPEQFQGAAGMATYSRPTAQQTIYQNLRDYSIKAHTIVQNVIFCC